MSGAEEPPEGSQLIAAPPPTVRWPSAQFWFNIGTIIAAVAGAAFTGLTYSSSLQAIREQQRSQLAGERAEACAAVNSKTQDLIGTLTAIELLAIARETTAARSAAGQVSEKFLAVNDAAVLQFIGPTPLAAAERSLLATLADAQARIFRGPLDPDGVRAQADNVEAARSEFADACGEALRDYRGD